MKRLALASAVLLALTAASSEVEAAKKKAAPRQYSAKEKSQIHKYAWSVCKKKYRHVLHVTINFSRRRFTCYKY